MARPSVIDGHEKRDEILKAMAMGVPSTQIAETYGMHSSTVDRYRKTVPSELRKASEEAYREGAFASSATLHKSLAIINKVMEELDTRLTDPGDPSRYWLGPQADEVDVLWTEYRDGKPIQHRDNFQELLEQVMGKAGGVASSFRWKREDPRKLLLAAADLLGKQIERFEKIAGGINESNRRDAEAHEVDVLMAKVVQVLDAFPEAREQVINAIRETRNTELIPAET